MSHFRSHVALLTFPFGNHAAILFNLAGHLAASLPTAAFSFFTTVASKSSLSARISASTNNLTIYTVDDGLPENFVPTGNPLEHIEYFLRATPGNFYKGFESVEAAGLPRIGLILSDSFLCFAYEMAVEMGVPWISLWVSSPTVLAVHFHTQTIRDQLGFRDDDDSAAILSRADEYIDVIPSVSYLKIGDLPEGIVFGGTKHRFAELLKEMAELSPKAAAVIFNIFEHLDPTIHHLRSHFQKCLPVGPIFPEAPSTLAPGQAHILEWLDCREPGSVAYVSFGTAVLLSPSDITELAEGLASTGKPFLLSLKDQQQQMLPSGFLERVRDYGLVVKWAPQVQVLAHVSIGAFLTHCGWTSVMESIAGAVPMLCYPFFGDQRINGRMVSDVLKIGVLLDGDGLTRGGVKKNLELLLSGEEGKVMRENVGALKAQANPAIRRGGSSFESMNALVQMISSLSVIRK